MPHTPHTGTFTDASPAEVATVLTTARKHRRQLREINLLLTSRILALEAQIKRRGGATSKIGKELDQLRRKVTFVHMASAGFRNAIREAVNPASGAILHCNFKNTCRGMLACGPMTHELMAAIAQLWSSAGGATGQLTICANAAESILRAVALDQNHALTDPDRTLEFVGRRVLSQLEQLFGLVGVDLEGVSLDTAAVWAALDAMRDISAQIGQEAKQLSAEGVRP